MAELDIGKHCQIDSCNQKDFLPFVCDSCSGVFCLEHRSREAHSCSEEPVKREPRTEGGSTSYPCSFQDCKGKELLPVICPQCEKHFCLAHRHQDDHKCEKLVVQKPRMEATKELVQKIIESKDGSKSKGRRGAKNSATAAKVALMKLKLHAAGDKGLPQTERTYFQVYLPKEAKDSSQPMFFCSKWSCRWIYFYIFSGVQTTILFIVGFICLSRSGVSLRLAAVSCGIIVPFRHIIDGWVDRPQQELCQGFFITLRYFHRGQQLVLVRNVAAFFF
ncbi:Zinc finger protein 1 [Collichthys lucidus]|uniref:Zinc finger protein 1 n=1 Tax=Collichthys lucidus TaxID=240159 RepID=A0A4U5VH96_COLLU|nr:Zinc finger protein 1 [Collichthys lucidus]